MLGNGFDLYHKLFTQYNDFMVISEYCAKKYLSILYEKNNRRCIYEELRNLAESNQSIREKLLFYKDGYINTLIDEDQYREFISIIKRNCWFEHFLKNRSLGGWVDLETQITDIIKNIRNKDTGCLGSFMSAIKEKGDHSNNEFRYIGAYLISDGEYDDFLFEEYCKFVKSLKLFLSIFVDALLPNIANKYESKNDLFLNSDWIISFNYTDTYKQLYDDNAKITHIHGKLDKEIIVGINSDKYDNPGESDFRFIQYKKYYQRITKQTLDGLNRLLLRIELEENSSVFRGRKLCVIGHSLDTMDEDIITVIFEWFDQVEIYYHNAEALEVYTKNLSIIFGAKELSKMTFAQKIIFKKLPDNEYVKEHTNDQL